MTFQNIKKDVAPILNAAVPTKIGTSMKVNKLQTSLRVKFRRNLVSRSTLKQKIQTKFTEALEVNFFFVTFIKKTILTFQ
jgi:hypothetical protein